MGWRLLAMGLVLAGFAAKAIAEEQEAELAGAARAALMADVYRADRVVQGKVRTLSPMDQKTGEALAVVDVTEVLKGPADIKQVVVRVQRDATRFAAARLDIDVGTDGVWVLKQWRDDAGQFLLFSSEALQPTTRAKAIRGLVELMNDKNAATSEPEELDGLSIVLDVRPAKTRTSDPWFYRAVVKNVSDKDLGIYKAGGATLQAVRAADGKEFVLASSLLPPPPAPPALSVLKPGATWEISGTMAPRTLWVEAGEKGAAGAVLTPGGYTLVCRVRLIDPYPPKELPAKLWTGTMEAQATVEVLK